MGKDSLAIPSIWTYIITSNKHVVRLSFYSDAVSSLCSWVGCGGDWISSFFFFPLSRNR